MPRAKKNINELIQQRITLDSDGMTITIHNYKQLLTRELLKFKYIIV